MKAAIHKKCGQTEVVKLTDDEKPTLKVNEVLIKVFATTVNRLRFRSANYFISRLFSGLFKPKQQTLGNEFASEIESVGKDVTTFKIGDMVLVIMIPGLVCTPGISFYQIMMSW